MLGHTIGDYVEVIESSPNCDVAKASFDTYNDRDWSGYQALQHPRVQWYEVEGRFFSGVDGVTEEVDNWRDAYPEASADVTNLVDCGDDRVLIEWTLNGQRRGLATGPEGQEIPENIRVHSADTMQLRDGNVYAGRTYYSLESAQTVHAVQGGLGASSPTLPDTPQYRLRLDDTVNARDARAALAGRLSAAYPGGEVEIANLVDYGSDRVIIEWSYIGGFGRTYGCDLMQLREGTVYGVRTYYGLVSAGLVIAAQGADREG